MEKSKTGFNSFLPKSEVSFLVASFSIVHNERDIIKEEGLIPVIVKLRKEKALSKFFNEMWNKCGIYTDLKKGDVKKCGL